MRVQKEDDTGYMFNTFHWWGEAAGKVLLFIWIKAKNFIKPNYSLCMKPSNRANRERESECERNCKDANQLTSFSVEHVNPVSFKICARVLFYFGNSLKC